MYLYARRIDHIFPSWSCPWPTSLFLRSKFTGPRSYNATWSSSHASDFSAFYWKPGLTGILAVKISSFSKSSLWNDVAFAEIIPFSVFFSKHCLSQQFLSVHPMSDIFQALDPVQSGCDHICPHLVISPMLYTNLIRSLDLSGRGPRVINGFEAFFPQWRSMYCLPSLYLSRRV